MFHNILGSDFSDEIIHILPFLCAEVFNPFARKSNKKLKFFLPKRFYELFMLSDKKLQQFTIRNIALFNQKL